MGRSYYTLAVREHGVWAPQFGDYDREAVREELEYYAERIKRADLKIVQSGDTPGEINAAVRALNS